MPRQLATGDSVREAAIAGTAMANVGTIERRLMVATSTGAVRTAIGPRSQDRTQCPIDTGG